MPISFFHVDSCVVKRPSREKDKTKKTTLGFVSVNFGITTSLSWMFGGKSLHSACALSKARWLIPAETQGNGSDGGFIGALSLKRKKHIFFFLIVFI